MGDVVLLFEFQRGAAEGLVNNFDVAEWMEGDETSIADFVGSDEIIRSNPFPCAMTLCFALFARRKVCYSVGAITELTTMMARSEYISDDA